MQIEEGFRDMKSTKFGLGYEQNKSVKKPSNNPGIADDVSVTGCYLIGYGSRLFE